MPSRRPCLYHYKGTDDRRIRLALYGKLAEDEFGFSLDVAGIGPVDLHFHFGELERVLKNAERTLPETLRSIPWLDQVQIVMRELETAGDDEQRQALAAMALYLAHNCPPESHCSSCASETMIERERQQHSEIGRVYLFMMIDAEGGIEVGLADQEWFDGDDWALDKGLDDFGLGKVLNWSPTFH